MRALWTRYSHGTRAMGERLPAFPTNTSGTISVQFAIMSTLIFGAAALMLDFGYATTVKVRQQNALDAATLAASDQLGTTNGAIDGETIASAFYKANTARNPEGVLMDVTLNEAKGTVSTNANTGVDTWLMRALGIRHIGIPGKAEVSRASGTVEIALVLDNSGSMAPEMDNLKAAAKEMAGILFVGTSGTEKVRVGLVPFAASVNVGSANANASWIDSGGLSPTHMENISGSRSRFDLFSDVGQPWRGCVEARPSPYDVSDEFPTSANPATLFVPMFAPDEPDPNNSDGGSYGNNYLVDDGGACTPQPGTCLRYSRRGNCQEWTKDPLTPDVAQSRICKYSGQTPSGGAGPNQNCTTAAILPLTSTRNEVEAAIDGMVASGWTNILEGTTWGWRVLSSGEPFTQGRSDGDSNNRKFLVIMSDGENTYQRKSNHNGSMYGAFGFTSKGRLSAASPETTMNEKTLAACNAAKAAGIMVFTVAFRDAVTSSTARNLLAQCATDSTTALLARDSAGLKKAFEDIGREISQLRISG